MSAEKAENDSARVVYVVAYLVIVVVDGCAKRLNVSCCCFRCCCFGDCCS